MFKPSSFNINYYLNMTNRGYSHDQVINSIQYERKEKIIKDIEEFYNKKPTGNRVLGFTCSFCPYKRSCWGDKIKYLPQQQSKGKTPKYIWYTEINNPRVDENPQ